MALTYEDVVMLGGGVIQVFTIPDRRPTASSSLPIKWMYQMDLECVLYNDDNETRSTGAAYRLLQRTPGAAGRALCLRKRSIHEGLINEAEWDLLREPLDKSVRMLTLVPVDTAVKAATVFGESKESAALIKALGFERPAEWDESDGDESEEGEEGGEQRRDDGDDSDSGEHSGDRSEGEASVAATEQFDHQSDSDGADDGGEANDAGSGSAQGGGGVGSQVKKARVTTYTLIDVPASLQRELDAFTEWRIKPINREREGVSVQPVTVAGNKADTLRLLGWLKSERNVVPSIGGVFGSERLGEAVQKYMDYLRECGRAFTTCAGYVKSFLAIARFVYSTRLARAAQGTAVSSGPVDAMARAHRQIVQQARLEQKFARKPKAWLDWSQILTARARAVREYDHCKLEDGPGGHKVTSDCSTRRFLSGSRRCRPIELRLRVSYNLA